MSTLGHLDPYFIGIMDEVKPVWRNVLKTARKAGVFIESNYEEFFNEENIPLRQSAFDFLQETAYICDLFHPGFCISTALNSVVEYDGSVIPCVNDRIVLGNLHETRFSEIWNGKPIQGLRQSHFHRRLRPKCETCKSFHHFD